jgi:pimeloyl-ACP methyl ester carboxylesterase
MSKTRISEHLANNSTEFIRVATLEELKAAGKIVIRGTRCPLVVVYDHGKVLLSIIAVRILASCYDGIVAFSQTDFTEDLKNITVPVLVMHSEDDQIVP